MATDAASLQNNRPTSRPLKKPPRKRSPWWRRAERAVLYPTVLAALIGVSPQLMERAQQWWLDLPVSKKEADRLSQLWQRNYICAAAPGTWLTTSGNIRMFSNVCDTGDVFVHATTADGRDHFGWLSRDDIIQSPAPAGGGLVGAANAATLPAGVATVASMQGVARFAPVQLQAQPKVICQRMQDSRYVIRRVQAPAGCADKKVDVYTGTVVSLRSAPCIPRC